LAAAGPGRAVGARAIVAGWVGRHRDRGTASARDIGIRVAAVEGVVRVDNLLHAPESSDDAGSW